VDIMQIRLSPAHPDFGKVGFAELEDRVVHALQKASLCTAPVCLAV
jgi:hypothetical protein